MWVFLELICEGGTSNLSVLQIAYISEDLFEYIEYIQYSMEDYYSDLNKPDIETLLRSDNFDYDIKKIKRCVFLSADELGRFQNVLDFETSYCSYENIDPFNRFETYKLYIEALKYLETIRNDIKTDLYHLYKEKIKDALRKNEYYIFDTLIQYLKEWKTFLELKSLNAKIIPEVKSLIASYLGQFQYFTISTNTEIENLSMSLYSKPSDQYFVFFNYNFLENIEVNLKTIRNITCLSAVVKYMTANNLKTAYFISIPD